MSADVRQRSRALVDILAPVITAFLEVELRSAAPSDPAPPRYSIEEFLQRNGIGRSHFYKQVAAGRLKIVHDGRRAFVTADEERRYQQAEAV